MTSNTKNYILGGNAQALARYPHARRAGPFLYVSGTSSRRLDNSYAGATKREDGTWDTDIRVQTKAVIENIKAILAEAGATLADLVDLTVFLVDMRDYAGFNEIYNTYFDAETGPARTTVAVKQLPGPTPSPLLIEIKAVAIAP